MESTRAHLIMELVTFSSTERWGAETPPGEGRPPEAHNYGAFLPIRVALNWTRGHWAIVCTSSWADSLLQEDGRICLGARLASLTACQAVSPPIWIQLPAADVG